MYFCYKKKIHYSFVAAIARVKHALDAEGFGVLTEIDARATFKKKMDIDFMNYVILGACNPPLAHMALLAEKEVGLLLPCNLIVYEEDEDVYVSIIKPTVALGLIKNKELKAIAEEAEKKLKKVVKSI